MMRGKRFERFHRILAVAVAIFMVISIVPVQTGDAAAGLTYYSYSADGSTHSVWGSIKDMRDNPPRPYYSLSSTDPRALFYVICRGDAYNYMGYATTAEEASSYVPRQLSGTPNTSRAVSHATIFGVRNTYFSIIDESSSQVIGSTGYMLPEVHYVTGGYVSATYEIPVDKMLKTGYRLKSNYIRAKTGTTCWEFAGGGKSYYLPSGWQNGTSVNLPMYLKYDNMERFSNYTSSSRQNYLVGVKAMDVLKSVDLYLDYELAGKSKVTYDPNGGEGERYQSAEYTNDGLIKAPVDNCTFTREHYLFNGWNTQRNGTGTSFTPTNTPTVNMYDDVTLYAQWLQDDIQAVYDSNGAHANYANVPKDTNWYQKGEAFTVKEGNTEEAPLRKEGKLFNGWNTKPDGSGTHYDAGDQITNDPDMSSNVVLYAEWEDADVHPLEYTAGGEDGNTVTIPYYDDHISETKTVTADNNNGKFTSSRYTFLTWKRALDGERYAPGETFTYDINQPKETLDAVWGAVLTYNHNNADEGTAPEDKTIYELNAAAETAGNPGNLKKDRHIFGGWDKTNSKNSSDDPDYKPGDTVTMGQNTTLYTHWSPAREYQVTYDAGLPDDREESDLVGDLPKDNTTYYGDGRNQTAIVKKAEMKLPGYHFLYWKDKDNKKLYEGDRFTISGDNSSVTLRAEWEKARDYTLSYDANPPAGAKEVQGDLPADQVRCNDGINDTFKVENADSFSIQGQKFLYWSTTPDDRSGSRHYTGGEQVKVNELGKDTTLYAQWSTELTITEIIQPDKIYNGSAAWSGKLKVSGIRPGEKITVENEGGTYQKENGQADASAEQGKVLEISGLSIEGKGAGHYHFKDGDHLSLGSYDKTLNTFTSGGNIEKREITIIPAGSPDFIIIGDEPPAYGLTIKNGSTLGFGDSLNSSFGTPQYTCELTKPDGTKVPLEKDSEVSDSYILSVSGLKNDNYNITTETTKISVQYPGSAQVKVTYDANLPEKEFEEGWAVGSVPVDTNKYYTYDDPKYKNSVVNIMENTNLVRSGYEFLGWDTDKDCEGTPRFPKGAGSQFTITGNTTLYAVWKGSTELTITGIDQRTKEYDGTADYRGTITFKGAVPGKEVSITYTSASYDNKNTGSGKTITLNGIRLEGTGKDMYCLKDGGMYDQKADTITINSGSITPKPVTITAKADQSPIREGDALPKLTIETAGGTGLAGADKLEDLGSPKITCTGADGKAYAPGSEAGKYTLTPGGLTNQNYTYNYVNGSLTVLGLDGRTPAEVRFDGNGADGGTIPGNISCFTYDDPDRNDTVNIPEEEPSLTGCTFKGWSENPHGPADGSDNIYRHGSGNSSLKVSGDTVLYAVWEADTELLVTGITNSSKIYDNKDTWDGSLILDGVLPGDQVKAEYTKGRYSSKDAGIRDITAEEIRLTGENSFRYILKDGGSGIYDEAAGTLKAEGEILKKPIELTPYVKNGNPAEAGAAEPEYTFKLSSGSMAEGETLSDLNTDGIYYTILARDGSTVKWEDIKEAAGFTLTMGGVTGNNYDISYGNGYLGTFDRDKKTVRVIYHNNPENGIYGNPPVDTTDYFLYTDADRAKDTPDVQMPEDLFKHGYKFKEWNTKKDGTGETVKSGKSQLVVEERLVENGEIHLWPVFEGDTPLTISALTDKQKVYDGTSKWNGDFILEGIEEGDDIHVNYEKGYYTDYNAGEDKAITVEGIKFTGRDLDKYIIQSSGIYDPVLEEAVDSDGKIKPRTLEIVPTATPDELNVGDPLPIYGLYLPAQSKIINPDQLKDFGEPAFKCRNLHTGEALSQTSEIGDYTVTVTGLEHQNYEINAGTARVKVTAPGMKEVHVTYRSNGGNGAVPVDRNTYYICDDPGRNSTVSVLGNTLTRNGFKFLGWSENRNGKGNLYQSGNTFRIKKDTILYAVWEKLPEKNSPEDTVNPDDPKKPGASDPSDQPGSSEENGKTGPGQNNNVSDGSGNGRRVSDISEVSGSLAGTKEKGSKKTTDFTLGKTTSKGQLEEGRMRYFADEQIPKGMSPGNSGKNNAWDRNGIFGGSYGPIAECIIHWMIFIGLLLTALYDFLRCRYIKRKDREKQSALFDQFLPLLPLPAGILFFFLRQCVLDPFMILTWLFMAELGRYFIKREYRCEEEETEDIQA